MSLNATSEKLPSRPNTICNAARHHGSDVMTFNVSQHHLHYELQGDTAVGTQGMTLLPCSGFDVVHCHRRSCNWCAG
jgi:hypothetical protein